MMRIKNILATATVLAVTASAAFAQIGARPQIESEMVPPDKGTAEIGLGIQANLQSPSAWNIDLKFLPYLNRNLQIGGNLNYQKFSGFSGGFVEARADWNFMSQDNTMVRRTVPYSGLAVGTSFGDFDGSAWGVQGGVKHFLTNSVALFAEINWRKFSKTQGTGRDNDTRLLIGLNTYLRK